MKVKIGIIYATVDGQTLKISKVLQKELLKSGNLVEIYSIEDFNEKITNFDTLIIGSSIRYGVHHKKIIEFINSNKPKLDTIKTAFFSVNLVARKPEKNTPTANPYVVKFFKTITWKPTIVEVFAGKLDYKKYPFFDRIMIQFIMWMTKGPTDKTVEIEYTNWDKVAKFGKTLQNL
ncbi:MAG: menaquinone-dependent protoporphyrinogen IX dehydrogenase [Lutibacter sp.]|uniref:menaquinone-dependent protoporphyrinogen IX dehydrogenase n=1 Tax=Lutibacter sp. TaxID=1925666 RepID=UPI001A0C9860|nr:menaquinone-dependent protoporphyrinogen IX dehydrogenase [Lutibacter sp.]NOR28008.1 menaquinone-dependent protoporphyrinogen IX dehydrogenase [Lutibacter sp.]